MKIFGTKTNKKESKKVTASAIEEYMRKIDEVNRKIDRFNEIVTTKTNLIKTVNNHS